MPRIPKLQRYTPRQRAAWSPFPRRPQPFRFAEWETKEHDKYAIVRKIRAPGQIPKITPYKEWPIIRDDLVEVCVGPDTGKQGRVRAVARKKNLLKVEGINYSHEYMDDMGNGKPGYMLNEEPLHYTEVKLVNPTTGRGTDVFLRYDETGKRVRVCKETGYVIPKPPFRRTDWKVREAVPEGEFDTIAGAAEKCTYVPSLLLFHEEVMLDMKIPMSVQKTELDRRDLIMKEIEEDILKEEEERAAEEQQKTFFERVKEKLIFWR